MKNLADAIKICAKETDFSGVVSIFKDNMPVYNGAFGYRDIRNNLLNDVNTKFGIASGTKTFTALGIGKLIEQKKLSLDTRMKDIDKDFKGFIHEEATILNLLTHTSGMYDYLDEETLEDYDYQSYEIPWYELETPSDYYPLYKDKQMKFTPGERYSYSNGGYVFLGMIIERISNMLYRDFIKENILIPAGMKDSDFYAFNDLPENTANGYLDDGKTTNIYKLPIRGGGDGGMYTTAKDLVSFWNFLLSDKLLSKELTDEFLKTHVTINDNLGYGCGLYKLFKIPSFVLVGGDAGVGFYSKYVVNEKLVISILTNRSDGEEAIKEVINKELNLI